MKIPSGPDEIIEPGSEYWLGATNISPDLRYLYGFYTHHDTAETGHMLLGEFDTQTSQRTLSTEEYNSSVFMTGFEQYRDFLYSSGIENDVTGRRDAVLVKIPGLGPVTDLAKITQDELTGRLIIVPFGDYFLLGTDSRVIQMSLDGEIVREYSLPQDWVNRNYMIVEYRK